MGYTILYDDDELRVVHRRGSSHFTLATFPGLGVWARARHMWAEEPVEKLDLEAVGFLCKRANWYPAASVERAAPAVRSVLRPVAIGYGYSMGGYGVLKHGRRVGLSHVVSLSPQVSIDPADIPQDTRFHRAFDPARNAGMRVVAEDLPPWALMVYDPAFPGDRMQAELLDGVAGLTRFRYPYLNHGTLGMLAGTGTLRGFIDLVLRGEMDAVRAYLRALRPTSSHWFRYLARANAVRGRWERAETLWRRAIALGMPAAVADRDRAAVLQADAELPAGPPPRAARPRSRLNAAILDAARQGDGAAAIDTARRLPPDRAEPAAVLAALNAALDLGDGAAVEAMARLAIGADMPRAARAACAMRLARAGRGALAIQVLLADPVAVGEGPGQPAVLSALRLIGSAAAGDPSAQATAQHLLRRLLNTVPERREPSRFGFAGGSAAGLAVMLGPEVTLDPAPGIAPELVAEARNALSAFVTEVELSPPPRVRMLADVFVNRRGQVWNAEGGVLRAQRLPLPKASLAAMARAPAVEEAALALDAEGDLRGWLTDGLAALAWRLDGAGEGLPLLVRDDAPAHVAESIGLAAAGAPPELIAVGDAVRVRRLHFGEVALRQFGHHAAFQGMLSRLAERAGTGGGGPVCLAAPGRAAPMIADGPAWRALLAEFGIRVIVPEELSVERQLAEVNGAAAIIAEPGASLGVLALAVPGRRVFEVMAAQPGGLAGRLGAANLSRIRGHAHHLRLEPAAGPGGAVRPEPTALRDAIGAFLAA